MNPIEMMVAAQQYQAPQGLLQLPTAGLLSVPDMNTNYTDMSLSDEEIRKLLELDPDAEITPAIRMQAAGQRIKNIPGNIMNAPENIASTFGDIGSGLLGLFGQ